MNDAEIDRLADAVVAKLTAKQATAPAPLTMLTTREVASRLKCSVRQASRIMRSIIGVKAGAKYSLRCTNHALENYMNKRGGK